MTTPARLVSPLSGRADAAIKRLRPDYSRAEIQRLFRAKEIKSNGRALKPGDDVTEGDIFEVPGELLAEQRSFARPNPELSVAIAHQDARLLVFNKPPGLPSHPLDHHDAHSALSAAIAIAPEIASASDQPREGGLLHRLDTDTGGALAFARDAATWAEGRALFSSEGGTDRAYLALVGEGAPFLEHVRCTVPIAHDSSDKRRMVVVHDDAKFRGQPKAALTIAKRLAASNDRALYFVRAKGGRRHQVRVHLADAGLPLLGDALYGGAPWSEGHHALWAVGLRFSGAPLLEAAASNRPASSAALAGGKWVTATPFGAFAHEMERLEAQSGWSGDWTSELERVLSD